ncbi:branched-chain amino acid ABC transporter permease [Halobacteriales archaeon QH_7_65_31]|nr:MAG: branched-chain amino acid ABC transporter permease [Halobacteriales archaeon QH_7_65_31]PSQ30284.1 MAG: branched-chain amino acid ABC transporter permease [Halobacteriales archaeon SW_6_65_46]
MSSVLQFVINGLLVGALFAATAVGFALIWGVVDIINLAHGEMLMLGGYVSYYTLVVVTGEAVASPALALATVPVAIVVVFVVGYLLQRLLVAQVLGTDAFLSLLVTFGLSIGLQQVALKLFSADTRRIAVEFADPSLTVGGFVVPKLKLVAFAGAIALTAALFLFLQRTRTGRSIRAVAQNPEAAALVGIDVAHTRAVTFGLASAIAAGAGAFIAMILAIQPQMGLIYTLKSFIIVVFGGIGSVPGALVGGLLLGTVEELVAGVVSSRWTLAVSFGLLIVLLIVKPDGLFGTGVRE